MSTADENKGAWKVAVAVIAVFALFIFLFIYGYVYTETQRQSGARTAKAVVIEKNFAPAQSVAGISSSGSYGIGSTSDRYIVAVRATEGASGIKEIDVPKNYYYRLNVGTEVRLTITSGDLGDDGKYHVEIDPSSIPALPATPPQEQPTTTGATNVKGKASR